MINAITALGKYYREQNPGLDLLDMPVDVPLRLRYRLWIHRGDAAEGKVPEQYVIYSSDWEWSPVRDGFQDSAVSGQ